MTRAATGRWAALFALNIAAAAMLAAMAPAEVGTTADRLGYEYVGQHPLAANCPHSIFCYRVLVPTLVQHLPLGPVAAWRSFAVIANGLSGLLLCVAFGGVGTPLIASMLFQTSFAATFALEDPFTPDPAVFLAGALLTLFWLRNRPWAALLVGLIGVFAKETVALVLTAVAVAAVFDRSNPRRKQWWLAAIIAWGVLGGFHVLMNTFAGYSESGSGSADLLGGAWLGRWLTDPTLTPTARAFYLFVPFGFTWLYAVLGFTHAWRDLRLLAVGAAITIPALIYVQTPERALGTAASVVVPLAAVWLARQPLPLALAAAISNGLLTARVGLSTPWLPPVPYLLVIAAIVAAVAIARSFVANSTASVAVAGSSRATTSSR